jgi:hypothetical protein
MARAVGPGDDGAVRIFRCANCQAWLTGPVREVPLPDPDDARAPYEMPDGQECPPRMRPGTFAVDRGAGSSVVLCPADVRDLRPIHGKGRRNGCCGPDGMDGPNLACAGCGAEVATESADCWTWQQVVLLPTAVESASPTSA